MYLKIILSLAASEVLCVEPLTPLLDPLFEPSLFSHGGKQATEAGARPGGG